MPGRPIRTFTVLPFLPERLAGLPEVRPGGSEDAWPKGTGFSGLPDSEIEPTFKENLPAALALINCAGQDKPAAPNKTKDARRTSCIWRSRIERTVSLISFRNCGGADSMN